MPNICFLITTYNRQRSCQELVDSLQGLGDIIVAHDGNDYEINGAVNLNPKIHFGKTGYWKLINMLYKNRTNCKYYFTLPDDFLISVTQIKEAINLWERIDDPRKICLNLYADREGKRCWTNIYPIDKGSVWQTGWVDMCFLCEDDFFQHLGIIPSLFPKGLKRIKGSSRVGAYISRLMVKKKFNMYQVKESLITLHDEHFTSQMQKIC